MISHSKIDKIGDKIKAGAPLTRLEGEALLSWRNSFVDTLDYYHKRVKAKIDSDSIVTIGKRLKRIPSINKKLKRSKTLRLSSMQDVAGLRVVLRDQSELLSAVNVIRSSRSKNSFKKMQDYHARPKEDGYRSIHLVYQTQQPKKLIEIQFRTEMQHIWATAVEVYGALQNTSFKTGEGDHGWKEFFKLLSSLFAMLEASPVLDEHKVLSKEKIESRTRTLMRKLQVIEQLASISNGIRTVVKSHSQGKSGKYAIIELDLSSGQTKIDIYRKKEISEAIKIYTNKEFEVLNDPSKNIVLANIESLESLQEAYPNYFLDTQKLIRILGKIALKQTII